MSKQASRSLADIHTHALQAVICSPYASPPNSTQPSSGGGAAPELARTVAICPVVLSVAVSTDIEVAYNVDRYRDAASQHDQYRPKPLLVVYGVDA